MSTKSEYCVHIFDSIQNECDKRGEDSKECILLNDIFDKKCTKHNSDCINMIIATHTYIYIYNIQFTIYNLK